jgi:S-DNA-T family DNA segregation ATPase FtsK/SpoIIIE
MAQIPIYRSEPIPSEQTMEGKILAKLKGLGVSGVKIKTPLVGPIVTGYPLALDHSTAISKITSKEDDIALALGVESVDIRRIKGDLVVFVPNEDRKIVDFKDALYWFLKDEEVSKMTIPILLGMDFQGNCAAIDLAKQPHILIAGSTGSGKSIFESSIISALVMARSEKELSLYIVDPKKVDLTLFDSLPHVVKMIEDAEGWESLIENLYNDVQNRNKFLKKHGVRNILEYNAKFPSKKMKFKVLIIDELADLKEKAKMIDVNVDDGLQRLIQVCRAAGVYIIACTQRTTVDIVSGTVKANFPTRIALRLPQSNDSRAILGQNGAEHLLGKGDMLIKSESSDELQRFHAPFVKMEDIETILASQERIKEAMGVM